MSKQEVIAVLGNWEGYTLGTVGRVQVGPEGAEREEVHLELLPIRGQARVCSGCGKDCCSIHDTVERWVDGGQMQQLGRSQVDGQRQHQASEMGELRLGAAGGERLEKALQKRRRGSDNHGSALRGTGDFRTQQNTQPRKVVFHAPMRKIGWGRSV